jgi:asparagine synthase (glutamine-hydrolysing)
MCGITGFIDKKQSYEDAEELIDKMCQIIRHRGPDEQGTWVGDGIALGMRRLSIIDLDGGHQPIWNEDRSILLVFNGEIYNYRDLQRTLQMHGHSFRTDSDTEAIVHAYEEYGDECVTHLRGMFAFALWDRTRQRLLAARDRFGKKPLHYYWDGHRLIFGSEMKSILEAEVAREVNPFALDDYLAYGYLPSPHTIFKGILKLPPAHILIYEDGHISTKRYWDLPFTPTCQDDEATAIERTRALLKDAVQVRLMSEVPLGAFLSGGVDSSLVVGLMSQLMSRPVKTFSIGFQEDWFNELPFARLVAKHFGTDHHELIVQPELVSILPELVWAYDEPFADSSMLPTYYVSKLAREQVKVVLTGDGGDEIFAGYTHYRQEYVADRIPFPLRLLLGWGGEIMPTGIRGKRRLQQLYKDYVTRGIHARPLFPAASRSTLYQPDYFALVSHHEPHERERGEYHRAAHLDAVTRMQYVDTRVYLPDDILVKVDRASMVNSLETRAPMLDQDLVEYVSSLPARLRVGHGVLKSLLKQVAASIVPAEILARRKTGFSMPIDRWLREKLNTYAYDVLTSASARQRGIFRPQFVEELLKAQAYANHGKSIWALLCLELWFQIYIDQCSSTRAAVLCA